MFVSFSKNFVFIRVPKAASTSSAVMLYDSGILDMENDYISSIEAGTSPYAVDSSDKTFRPANDKFKEFTTFPDNSSTRVDKLNKGKKLKINLFSSRHMSYEGAKNAGFFTEDMPCYSTIRNPIDRFISASYFYHHQIRRLKEVDNNLDLNVLWDEFINGGDIFRNVSYALRLPQYTYLSENPIVWNIENLEDWIVPFITEKGGTCDTIWTAKTNNLRPRTNYDDFLTADRQQQILEVYSRDLELWENAYQHFN